jgi:effector-binding domain-containing protein
MHKGPYGETSAVYGEIFQWLQQNGYRHVEGQPSREVFHVVCGQVDNPEEYLTEVQVPVEKV